MKNSCKAASHSCDTFSWLMAGGILDGKYKTFRFHGRDTERTLHELSCHRVNEAIMCSGGRPPHPSLRSQKCLSFFVGGL